MDIMIGLIVFSLLLVVTAIFAASKQPPDEPCEGKSFAYCASCHRKLHDLCSSTPEVNPQTQTLL
jgi:hypothetical protein